MTLEATMFAYLERDDYQKQLMRANLRDIQKKMYFLKENRMFQDMSIVKLQKMSYYMNQVHLTKG